MERDKEADRKFWDSIGARYAAALGIGATVAAVGVAVHKKRAETQAPESVFAERLALLTDPAELPKVLQIHGDEVLKDMNRLAALLVDNVELSRDDWQRRSGMSDRRFGTLKRQFEQRKLLEQASDSFYRPGYALLWAAAEPESYPALAAEIEALHAGESRREPA